MNPMTQREKAATRLADLLDSAVEEVTQAALDQARANRRAEMARVKYNDALRNFRRFAETSELPSDGQVK